LIERVAETIRRHGLLRGVRCVLVGVSGGADSVALLAVLRELAGRFDAVGPSGAAWRVAAAHLNHGIRAAAEADARFVQALCESWQVECVVGVADVPAEAKRTGESIESAARRVRYEFLAATAERADAQAVAVAHHADDNAETVLHRALRGTGLAGLAGIPVERPLGKLRLIRPMLHGRRDEIEQFLTARNLSWREDETNRHLDHRRNVLRHQLLPLIRERINPRAADALLRLAEQAQTAQSFLRAEAERVLEISAAAVPCVAGILPARVADVSPARVADVSPARVADVPPARVADVPPARVAGVSPAPGNEVDLVSSSGQPHGTHNAGETPATRVFSASVLAAAHPAVRGEAIRLIFERAGLPARDLDAATVARACELVCDPAAKAVNLPRDWRLVRRRDVVWCEPPGRGDRTG